MVKEISGSVDFYPWLQAQAGYADLKAWILDHTQPSARRHGAKLKGAVVLDAPAGIKADFDSAMTAFLQA